MPPSRRREMTIKKLQAKLAKAEAEAKSLQVYRKLIETQAEGGRMFMSCIHQYECKVCMLMHFPEPLTKCPRLRENKEHLAREKRIRERYFNEFRALIQRCTDEHGKVQWKYVERSTGADSRAMMF
jgi:hypothetical protein